MTLHYITLITLHYIHVCMYVCTYVRTYVFMYGFMYVYMYAACILCMYILYHHVSPIISIHMLCVRVCIHPFHHVSKFQDYPTQSNRFQPACRIQSLCLLWGVGSQRPACLLEAIQALACRHAPSWDHTWPHTISLSHRAPSLSLCHVISLPLSVYFGIC